MINFLKSSYRKIWVPFFGRLLALFIPVIEGKPPKNNPTYKLRDQ
ncbi:hypothetical protein [Prochlorococcus sp. MIT 1223]|nr:hypothetical protein [Prochlorococcus sp. MIT 1223]